MKIRFIALNICICAISLSNVFAGTIMVTTTADSGAGSLRNVIGSAGPGETIEFDASLKGQAITLTSDQLLIDKDLTITGPGADQLTVTRSTAVGTPGFHIFHVTAFHTVVIEGITISNGLAEGPKQEHYGGGIYNSGALTVRNAVITNNSARYGGGIFNDGTDGDGQLTISNCNVSNNEATTSVGGGGGIYNYGLGALVWAFVVLDNSTISDNSAPYGAGIYSTGYDLGHAFLIISNSTISGNAASQWAGGIFNDGRFKAEDALLVVSNSTISGNSAAVGGAIVNDGEQGEATLVIGSSTVSDNSAAAGGGIYNHDYTVGRNIVSGSRYSIIVAGLLPVPQGAELSISNTILKAGAEGENILNSGRVYSFGYNISSDDGGGLLTGAGDQIETDPLLSPLSYNGGPTLTHRPLAGSPALNAGDPTFTPPPDNDQRGPGFPRVVEGRIEIGAIETAGGPPVPSTLLNISTRLRVLTGDNALIGGFIVTGTGPKRVLVRGIGPSLVNFGVPDALADPMLELHGPGGFNTILNDNWRDTQEAEILAAHLAPQDSLESAIVAMLQPGAYTAVVLGNSGGVGVGLVEAYDLSAETNVQLTNISTRGFVDSGDNAMIGGFILGSGSTNATILIRGIGPSLAAFGVPDALANPTLELHDNNGATVGTNDDWRETQEFEIEETGLAPTDDLESAILQVLAQGAYTAIVRGKNGATGVALVEAYQLAGASMKQRRSNKR